VQDQDLALALAPARTLARALARAMVRALSLAIPHDRTPDRDLARALAIIVDPIDAAMEQNDLSKAQSLADELKMHSNIAVSRVATLMDDLLIAASAETTIEARLAQRRYIARILEYAYIGQKKKNYYHSLIWLRLLTPWKVDKSNRRRRAILEIYWWLKPYSDNTNDIIPKWGAFRIVRDTGALF
jgi:hypothetical protein